MKEKKKINNEILFNIEYKQDVESYMYMQLNKNVMSFNKNIIIGINIEKKKIW